MVRKKNKLFPKPTLIAVLAALLGLALHAAVFFLIEIKVKTPEEVTESDEQLSYLGRADPETVALIDPLTLLVESGRQRPGPGLEDFRALSISREISSFPPFFLIENNRDWSSWIPQQTNQENPGVWLLEQSKSSLQNFGREGLADLQLPADRMTLRVLDLLEGDTSYLSLPLPEAIQETSQGATFLNPATFLLDRTHYWSRPPALLVESSGDVTVDRAIRKILSSTKNGIPRQDGYSLVTYYLPPPSSQPSP